MKEKSNADRQLTLEEIPVSDRNINLGNSFLVSDNLDSSDILKVLNMSDSSRILINRPFKIRFTMIMVCDRGTVRLRVRMKEYALAKGDMIVLTEGIIGELLDTSEEAGMFIIAFSKDFDINDSDIDIRFVHDFMSNIADNPVINLSEEELTHIKGLYSLLRYRIGDPSFKAGRQLAVNCLRVLFSFITANLDDNNHLLRQPHKRGDRIFDEFLKLVDRYSISRRDLDFYSDRLCIYTKHLCRIVSQTSGATARHWICLRVIMEAKVLINEKDMTIDQVSERLNFPNQSFFGTFFKRHVGVSPSEYRAMGK